MNRIQRHATKLWTSLLATLKAADERGQGTTEYAILVGILAVIAMIAIAAFRDRISELWEAISSGINGL